MKDHSMLFGSYGEDGNLTEGGSISDDVLGELREEEIVWGEEEVASQVQYNEVGAACNEENGGMKLNSGRNQRSRQLSMLSRQMEMQGSTWGAAGDSMAAATETNWCSMKHEHGYVGSNGGNKGDGGTQLNMEKLIPPHELLARQYAASASFSVLHGAGRTLKGMDLRRLRNEVWRQTGFVD